VKQAIKDKKRLDKLKEILATLESGQDVANRTLRAWMGDDFDCIANRWEYYQEDKAEFKDKPDEIKQYEIYLKKALFAYNKKTKAYADGSFETALEYLQEIIVNNSLRVWFDRPIDFSISEGFSLDPIGVPRVVTSRSLDNLNLKSWPKKIDVKIGCVESAIDALENPIPELTEEEKKAQEKKLKQLLANLKNKR
jgi:exonuclease VII small subunit